MIIKRWRGNDVDVVPGLVQEYLHPNDWPFPQDWVVESLHLDTANRRYWVTGHRRETGAKRDGQPFFWGLYTDRPLDWRYDLTGATYQVGRHETEAEARKREDMERRALVIVV